MGYSNRRSFFKKFIIGASSALFAGRLQAGAFTPAEIEGPFYPLTPQKDKDFDLTLIEGRSGVAKGKVIYIEGRVLDADLQPVENATVDIWQANAAGRYRHPRDQNSAPLDKNFQGWAIVKSGKGGAFRFKTILPGEYPASDTWTRPPHIHFRISREGYAELTTQMYFPGNKLNDKDLLLNRKTTEERLLMIARKSKDDQETYEYDVVLRLV